MAPPPNTPRDKPLTLHARYQAPPDTTSGAPKHHVFSHQIPSSLALNRAGTSILTSSVTSTDTPTLRSAYLSDLSTAVVALQGEINVYLTARMEEDAQLARGNGPVEEDKEEANYGEEVGEEDE